MQRVKAREYARNNRLSLFQVIKKIQSGALRGEQVEENGVTVQYVYLDGSEATKEDDPKPPSQHGEISENGRNPLARELRELRREVALLRRTVERCCDKHPGKRHPE